MPPVHLSKHRFFPGQIVELDDGELYRVGTIYRTRFDAYGETTILRCPMERVCKWTPEPKRTPNIFKVKARAFYLRVKGLPGRVKQQETSTGLPLCINCDKRVPLNYGKRRRHRGRFCTNRCAMKWAHYVLNNMPTAKLWKKRKNDG